MIHSLTHSLTHSLRDKKSCFRLVTSFMSTTDPFGSHQSYYSNLLFFSLFCVCVCVWNVVPSSQKINRYWCRGVVVDKTFLMLCLSVCLQIKGFFWMYHHFYRHFFLLVVAVFLVVFHNRRDFRHKKKEMDFFFRSESREQDCTISTLFGRRLLVGVATSVVSQFGFVVICCGCC